MVIGVYTYLFQVIVLPRYPEALLRIRNTRRNRWAIAQEDILEWIHSCIREHESRVILDDHRRARNDPMAFRLHELQESFTDGGTVHQGGQLNC